jgi:membrane-bound inhibitor of C-type lysozyme
MHLLSGNCATISKTVLLAGQDLAHSGLGARFVRANYVFWANRFHIGPVRG